MCIVGGSWRTKNLENHSRRDWDRFKLFLKPFHFLFPVWKGCISHRKEKIGVHLFCKNVLKVKIIQSDMSSYTVCAPVLGFYLLLQSLVCFKTFYCFYRAIKDVSTSSNTENINITNISRSTVSLHWSPCSQVLKVGGIHEGVPGGLQPKGGN